MEIASRAKRALRIHHAQQHVAGEAIFLLESTARNSTAMQVCALLMILERSETFEDRADSDGKQFSFTVLYPGKSYAGAEPAEPVLVVTAKRANTVHHH